MVLEHPRSTTLQIRSRSVLMMHCAMHLSSGWNDDAPSVTSSHPSPLEPDFFRVGAERGGWWKSIQQKPSRLVAKLALQMRVQNGSKAPVSRITCKTLTLICNARCYYDMCAHTGCPRSVIVVFYVFLGSPRNHIYIYIYIYIRHRAFRYIYTCPPAHPASISPHSVIFAN